MLLKILTANRFLDGRPVWYDGNGKWSDQLMRAAIADTPFLCTLFEQVGKEAMAANEVLCAELIDVEKHQGIVHALRLRERIRANGPTIDYMVIS